MDFPVRIEIADVNLVGADSNKGTISSVKIMDVE
jgi:hypothetical protein